MNLINLWSADPLPTQLPQTFVFFAGPVQTVRSSSPVWRSSSSDVFVKFPGPISSAGFTGVVQLLGSASATSSMRLISLALGFPSTISVSCRVPRLHFGPLDPCLHLGLSACRLRSDSAFPRLHQGPSALALLGSLVHPEKPRSVVAQLPPQTSGLPAVPRPLGFWLHRAHPSLWFPSRPRSLHRRPGQPDPRLCISHVSQPLHLGLLGRDVTLVRRPLCCAGSSIHHGSTSVDWFLGVTQSFGQSSSLFASGSFLPVLTVFPVVKPKSVGDQGPYFNDLSAWSKARRKCTQGVSESTFASLTCKTDGAPGSMI